MDNKQLIDLIDDFVDFAESKVLTRAKQVLKSIENRPDSMVKKGTEYTMLVPASSGKLFYNVELEVIESEDFIIGSCDCIYAIENEDPCKHQVAMALLLKKKLKSEVTAAVKPEKKISKKKIPESQNARHKFTLSAIDYFSLSGYINNRVLSAAYSLFGTLEELADEKKVRISFKKDITATAKFVDKNHLEISCNCGKLTSAQFCPHVFYLLNRLADKNGPYYFYRYADFSKEKKQALAEYGLTPNDELARQFKFAVDYQGQFMIKEKPANLLKAGETKAWESVEKALGISQNTKAPETVAVERTLPKGFTHASLLFNLAGKYGNPFFLEGVLVSNKAGKESVTRIILKSKDDLQVFFDWPAEILLQVEKLTETAILDFLFNQGFTYAKSYSYPWNNLGQRERDLIQLLQYEVLAALRSLLSEQTRLYQIPYGQKVVSANIIPVRFAKEEPELTFQLQKNGRFLQLRAFMLFKETPIDLSDCKTQADLFLEHEQSLYLFKREERQTISLFANGPLQVTEGEFQAFFNKIVKPLSKKYSLKIDESIQQEFIDDLTPTAKIYLSELNENFLLIRPIWEYGDFEVEMNAEAESLITKNNKAYYIKRNSEEEQVLVNALRASNTWFTHQHNEYFYLPFSEALKGNWFINFYQQMQELNVPVFGMDKLKKFKYNANKPVFEMKASSGIDWFDLKIEVSYGDQVVPISELRKAIINKQEYILLGDGTFGALPSEWIEKYAMLLKMGQLKDGQLKVSKFHFTIVDELQAALDDDKIAAELHEKHNRLKNIETIPVRELPKSLTATLRDYQQSGFQWLTQLDELGWGGCLADDMGLGKTLQTIAFLQYVTDKHPKETHLVVCPTSLVYNWESELIKFAPKLRYHIYYGSDRAFEAEEFQDYDIIITSYGLLRSDIEHFNKFNFGYLVLDESQMIKNPSAQITKAVQVVQARNRIALSGTPVQNNTFDLFAQMHFLNPGMLGNMEFFKTEFANPIDKNADAEKSAELRKLIYPFMLRRTKEQVAKDLPDKTETILWCEMEKEQRKIYNSYKEHYRVSIMQRIAEDGLNKSGIYILEGLLRLRQICDSPALLKDKETDGQLPNVSVKLEELMREIEENQGDHKALVFSQFVSMLDLICKELDKLKIPYLRLDGATTAAKRKQMVKQFQEGHEYRVFLISLKAGGVGLNLTAADYVYLVDPWWNPAAEQQAIDRTHRIGQTNKIFAYKMICKDSVEEKIIQLQNKKKSLAADLISDESGFVKKLTKNDVEFLFS